MIDLQSTLLPFWFIVGAFTLVGACIGSFLNVAIYRLPLGLSVNSPKRSFCPSCKAQIEWYHNIPILSWCLLGGKCAHCGNRISIQYLAIEALTAFLFGLLAFLYAQHSLALVALLCIWTSGALVISLIDGKHMLVFPSHTLLFAVVGCTIYSVFPWETIPNKDPWHVVALQSIISAIVGYIIIRLIIELGKFLFGSIKRSYPQAEGWHLEEPIRDEDELKLVLPDISLSWSEIFNRPSDRVELTEASLSIDGKEIDGSHFFIYVDRITDSSGQSFAISEIKTASGSVKQFKASREAMGYGDAWILMMIGATTGWGGCVFCLLIGSLIGIIAGIIGRVGFGRPIPFGPCLLGACFIWIIGGYQLWERYCELFLV